ncbi:MAG: site-2 protease family protein [Anaerolineaceae bacterium]|nr:site-2 protease family protein [Anaerolineaceae bacterium]
MFGLSLSSIITRSITLVIAFTVHEFSHAFTADRFGDDTPRNNHRLTLNPLAHLDPIGTLMLLVAGFGWAKPVPVNPYQLRRHSKSALMWVSLAGPISNFLLAILAAIPIRLGLIQYTGLTTSNNIFPTAFGFFFEFIVINLALMIFNLIPLYPLDGEKVLDFFLPPRAQQIFDTIRPYSSMILLLLLFVLPYLGLDIIGWIMRPVMNLLMSVLLGV